MKKNRGFLLIETAAVFLLTGVLLLGALKLYGSGIRLQQRKQQLEKAWQAGQLQLFTGKTDDGFIVRENALEQDGLIMKEVQILDDKEKICCNLVQIEK